MTGTNPWATDEPYPQGRMMCRDCHEVSAAFEKLEGWTSDWAQSHSLYHGHVVMFIPAYAIPEEVMA